MTKVLVLAAMCVALVGCGKPPPKAKVRIEVHQGVVVVTNEGDIAIESRIDFEGYACPATGDSIHPNTCAAKTLNESYSVLHSRGDFIGAELFFPGFTMIVPENEGWSK